jgi:hypothetical protein
MGIITAGWAKVNGILHKLIINIQRIATKQYKKT